MSEVYLNNPKLKSSGVTINYTKDQFAELVKCHDDPVYLMKNYIKIVHLDRGLVNFEPYEFQERLIRTMQRNRFVISKIGRQSGKSITSVAYFIHYLLFNDDVKVAILANKLATAREILSRFQKAYENLPKWLQQGVVEWNKSSVVLENGSKIIAAATSSSAIRGDSFNVIFLDEFAFISNNMAEEFFNSTYPTISSGKTSKVFIVSTPNGMNHFYKMWKDAEEKRSTYVPFEVHWKEVPGRDDQWMEETIRNTSQRQFDQEYGCEFLGSSNTLIEGWKLRNMPHSTPVWENKKGTFKIYEKPEEGAVYMATADVSHGKGIDYSTVSIFDITDMPYRQVATFRDDTLSPFEFPRVIVEIAKQYNNAWVLVELNDAGLQVTKDIYYEYEYENLLGTRTAKRQGNQKLSIGGNNLGFRTTKSTKRQGCLSLKTLVETNKLLIPDFNTISELSTFIETKGSYAADEGDHDDMVMTLVIFAWAVGEEIFKEITEIDTRKRILDDTQTAFEEENMPPLGFFSDGESINNVISHEEGGYQTFDVSGTDFDDFMSI